MLQTIVVSMIWALVSTIIMEGAIGFLFHMNTRKKQLLMVLVNIFTNPMAVLVFYIYSAYLGYYSMIPQLVIEGIVIIVECCIYWIFSKRAEYRISHPILLGIVCNLVSWGSGYLFSCGI